jgi:hypothetical protein
MDQEFFDRWRSVAPPFDGLVLCLEDYLPLADLRVALRVSVAKLKAAYGDVELTAFDDWHQHDNYITESRPASWREVDDVLASDRSLYEVRDGDDYVHRAELPCLYRFDIYWKYIFRHAI